MPLSQNPLGLLTSEHLAFQRCPHCNTANPTFPRKACFVIQPKKPDYAEQVGVKNQQFLQWHVYACESCGGLAAAAVISHAVYGVQPQAMPARWIVPEAQAVSPDVPKSAANYLTQAHETLSSPDASILMCASATDAMLKERGYKDGTLYSRIGQAEKDGVLTKHMAEWAHDIRLDANDQRHADDKAGPKTPGDAQRCVDFADALAELLFALPARVKRGRQPPTPPVTAPPAAAPPPAGRPAPLRPQGR